LEIEGVLRKSLGKELRADHVTDDDLLEGQAPAEPWDCCSAGASPSTFGCGRRRDKKHLC
jgi:hypothetical protein